MILNTDLITTNAKRSGGALFNALLQNAENAGHIQSAADHVCGNVQGMTALSNLTTSTAPSPKNQLKERHTCVFMSKQKMNEPPKHIITVL